MVRDRARGYPDEAHYERVQLWVTIYLTDPTTCQ